MKRLRRMALEAAAEEEQEPQDLQSIYERLLAKRQRVGLLQGCRSIEDFEHLNVISEGTYGVVYRAKDKVTQQIHAIKKVKLEP